MFSVQCSYAHKNSLDLPIQCHVAVAKIVLVCPHEINFKISLEIPIKERPFPNHSSLNIYRNSSLSVPKMNQLPEWSGKVNRFILSSPVSRWTLSTTQTHTLIRECESLHSPVVGTNQSKREILLLSFYLTVQVRGWSFFERIGKFEGKSTFFRERAGKDSCFVKEEENILCVEKNLKSVWKYL